MIKQITTQEWKKISYAELGLNQEQAKSFKNFLEDKGLTTALDFQLDGIKTEAYVGTIRFADFQLNILPKIIGGNDSSCLENLMFMLRYTKKLEIQGVGYRANMEGSNLNLVLGYSHPILITPPEGIKIAVEANTKITVSGSNKQLVGDVAAEIRGKRPPEVYKGKGVRYEGEYVRRKAGKTGKK